MLPLTVSPVDLAISVLVPLAIGFFVGLLDGPFWVATLIISVFFGIFAVIVSLLVAVLGASLGPGLLLLGGSLVLVGLIAGYLVDLGFAYLGFWIGEKISD